MNNGVDSAIAEVMKILAKDGISKSRNNTQQGYKFRGIDDVYNALAPALVAAGLIVIPKYLSRESVERTSAKGTALFYVTVQATYRMICVADGTEKEAGPFYGEAMDSADKATNKAMSAAHKYWALQTFNIPTDADNDADATTHEVAPAKRDGGARQTAVDAFEAMKPDEQAFLEKEAIQIIAHFEGGGDVRSLVESKRYDNEEKLALWSLLPSKVRSAIKKPTNGELGSQA